MNQSKNLDTDEADTWPQENIAVLLPSNQYSKEQLCIAFGWGKYRPKCLQFLNSPRWFIVVVVVFTLCQGNLLFSFLFFFQSF